MVTMALYGNWNYFPRLSYHIVKKIYIYCVYIWCPNGRRAIYIYIDIYRYIDIYIAYIYGVQMGEELMNFVLEVN